MKQNIIETIRDIDLKIQSLETLRLTLQIEFGQPLPDPIPDMATPAPSSGQRPKAFVRILRADGRPRKTKWERMKVGRDLRARRPESKPSASPIRGTAVLSAALKLSDPFSPLQLSRACNLNPNSAAGACYRWRASGYVKQVGKAQYVKTAKFPGARAHAKPAAAPVHIPGLDPEPKVSIQDQLARACAARDKANADGNTVLARLHQNNIEKLEKLL